MDSRRGREESSRADLAPLLDLVAWVRRSLEDCVKTVGGVERGLGKGREGGGSGSGREE
jgi:hypothetical protein